MAKVIITKKLEEEIYKIFKKESTQIFDAMRELENTPHKGKTVGQVEGIVVKELKYENYMFYFIADSFKIKILQKEELEDLLIKFVRLSDKKNQQRVIDEIKIILRRFGESGF